MTNPLAIPTREIRIAEPGDLKFILSLQKRFSNELGFLPQSALEWYLENGRVLLATQNEDAAGYILGRDSLRWNCAIRPITQAAICYDARRRHAGLALVGRTEAAGREAGQVATQACCRQGIEANEFWKAAGYEEICRLETGAARHRQMIVWRKRLTPFEPPWFREAPPVAGWKAKRTKPEKRQ